MPSPSTSSRRGKIVALATLAEIPVKPPETPEEPTEIDEPSADIWAVLKKLGADPAAHFAKVLLATQGVDEKRKDEAAKQLMPYCYARRATQAPFDEQGQLVGYVLCEG
jgi:hypothetical protein